MKKKTIIAAMDAGFDGCKMCINGVHIDVPFVIQDITDNEDSYRLMRIQDSFIKCRYEDRVYVLGQSAREFLLKASIDPTTDATMKGFYEMGRFHMNIFRVALISFLAYGLYVYSETTKEDPSLETFDLKDINKWEINVGVALPHGYTDELVPVINDYLCGKEHDIEIKVGNSDMLPLNIRVSRTFYNSQVICAWLNEVLDDEGNDVEEMYDALPALIIDGGYKTVGEFIYNVDGTVTDGVSNTDYAMLNINKRVVEIISEKTDGYADYQIEEFYKRKKQIRYLNEENQVEMLDVVKIKNDVIEKSTEKMIKHLLKDYNNLLDIETILIAGGTGGICYKYMTECCKNMGRTDIIEKMILAGNNKKIDIDGEIEEDVLKKSVMAIATGLYKSILLQIELEDEETEE